MARRALCQKSRLFDPARAAQSSSVQQTITIMFSVAARTHLDSWAACIAVSLGHVKRTRCRARSACSSREPARLPVWVSNLCLGSYLRTYCCMRREWGREPCAERFSLGHLLPCFSPLTLSTFNRKRPTCAAHRWVLSPPVLLLFATCVCGALAVHSHSAATLFLGHGRDVSPRRLPGFCAAHRVCACMPMCARGLV